jgi:hypothetical protein
MHLQSALSSMDMENGRVGFGLGRRIVCSDPYCLKTNLTEKQVGEKKEKKRKQNVE